MDTKQSLRDFVARTVLTTLTDAANGVYATGEPIKDNSGHVRVEALRGLAKLGERALAGEAGEPAAAAPSRVTVAMSSGEWPPPFAADKGFTQTQPVPGLAVTVGPGACFLHFRPFVQLGATSELQAMIQAAAFIELAAGWVVSRLDTLQPEAEEPAQQEAPQSEPVAQEDEGDPGQCTKRSASGVRCLWDAGHDFECNFPEVSK